MTLVFLGIGFFVFLYIQDHASDQGIDVVATVGERVIERRDVERHEREIFRDYFGEELSDDEIWEEALIKAIRINILEAYIESKNIIIERDEYEEALENIIAEEEGVETKEEFFENMRIRGFSEEEIEREIMIKLTHGRLLEQEILITTVTEENIKNEYEAYSKEIEGLGIKSNISITAPALEVIYEYIEERATMMAAEDSLNDKIREFERELGVNIF